MNYKENENNESFIKDHLSAELKIDIDDIKLAYVSQRIHEKFSVSAKENKLYCHKFYRAEISNLPENIRSDSFEIDGRKYYWRTLQELEANKNVMQKNKDIVEFVKGLF